MEKFPVIIVARLGASRFFGKMLQPIGELSMLEFLVKRIKKADNIGEIVVATSVNESDDQLEEFCNNNGISCFRGSEDNVLSRVYECAKANKFSKFIKILGDNPFVHSDLLNACTEIYSKENCDYVATLTNEYTQESPSKFPIGIRVQIISFPLIERSVTEGITEYNKEHSSSYIAQNLDTIDHRFYQPEEDSVMNKPSLTFAVNLEPNLVLLNKIHHSLKNIENYSLGEIIEEFEKHPSYHDLMGNDAKM